MIKYQLFIAVALLVGVAIGYFVKDEPVAANEPAKVEETVKKPVADKGDEAIVSSLRQEIVRLKKALSEKDGRNAETISNAVEKARQSQPPRFRNQREWLENLKKNEPERYVQVTNNMAQWRQQRYDRARSRIEFLSSLDVSCMSASARKTHADLQELIARREELEEQLHDEELTDEQRRALGEELGKTHQELQRLNDEERDNLLEEAARSLGLGAEDSKAFAETIQDVIDATEIGWRSSRRRGPRGQGGQGGR